MSSLDLLLRPVYNKAFRQLLDVEFWPEASIALALSTIPKLELLQKCEWNDGNEYLLSYLKDKYDEKGTSPCELYYFVSKDLRDEYDTIHRLIRSVLDHQFKDFT